MRTIAMDLLSRSRTTERLARAALASLLLLAAAPAALAQIDLWVPELPMTRDTGTSARALGLGGAYLALSEDAAALRYNPAGLARVSRIEFSGGLIDRRTEWSTIDQGRRSSAAISRTRINNVGFVYPFPTYRGSMVIALGYEVPYLMDREYLRSGPRSGEDLEESLFEEGSVGEWSFGFAMDVSPMLSLGFRTSFLSGSYFQDWTFRNEYYDDHNATDTEVGGFTGSLGVQARLADWGRLGLVLDLPRWVSLETELTTQSGEYVYSDEDVTYPFSVGAGVSGTSGRLLLTGDVRYTDWTQIDYEGPMRYTDTSGNRELAYRRALDLHLGTEYLLDVGRDAGLRLRAGIAREFDPYDVVFTDITATGAPVYDTADHDPERLFLCGGLGLLLQESLVIDVAYATGDFGRKGGGLHEEADERRLLITAGFRLD